MIVAGSLGIVQASAQAATIATTAAAVTPVAAASANDTAMDAGTAALPVASPPQLHAEVATPAKPVAIGAHAPQAPGLGGAVGRVAGDVLILEGHRTRCGPVEPGDQVEQGGLPHVGAANQHDRRQGSGHVFGDY